MGLIVNNYTTEQGFLVPELYIKINCIRMLKTTGGNNFGMVYSTLAYKSIADFQADASPITIPSHLANVEDYLTSADFYKQTIFGFAYSSIKRVWENDGYTVNDYYPNPPTPKTYIYDCSGYNFEGFNCAGYDKDGYDSQGFNAQGYNRQGYDREGYNKEGYNSMGLDKNGNLYAPPEPSMQAPSS